MVKVLRWDECYNCLSKYACCNTQGNDESLQATLHSKDNAIAEEKSDKDKLKNQVRGLNKLVEKKSVQSRGKIIKRIYKEKAYRQDKKIFTGLASAAFRSGSNYDASVLAGICQLRYDNKHKVGEKGWTIERMRKWRQEYAPPILQKIKKKLFEIKNSEGYLPKSLIAVATEHMLSEWEPMEAIFSMGDCDLDNKVIPATRRDRALHYYFNTSSGFCRAVHKLWLVITTIVITDTANPATTKIQGSNDIL